MKRIFSNVLFLLFLFNHLSAQQTANKPEREKWFMDLGFGMFIHWSVDVSVGTVISHSMAGASSDYLKRLQQNFLKYLIQNPFNRMNGQPWPN